MEADAADPMREDAPRLVVLVGLPGAGKSTVGPLVAARLGLPFVDLDLELERRAGRSIAAIFAADGESAFRAQEAALSQELAGRRALVLAPGGGWLTNPGTAPLRQAAVVVYLRVDPAVALARMGAAHATRPLLAGDDPLGALQALLSRRRDAYEAADATVEVAARSPDEVAAAVVAAVRALRGSRARPLPPRPDRAPPGASDRADHPLEDPHAHR
jgi:shikimate kinase